MKYITARKLSTFLLTIVMLVSAFGTVAFAKIEPNSSLSFDGLNPELTDVELMTQIYNQYPTDFIFDRSHLPTPTVGETVGEGVAGRHIKAEGGIFGKANDDIALNIYTDGTKVADNGGSISAETIFSTNEGNYTDVEVYMAWDGTAKDMKGVVAYYNLDTNINFNSPNAGKDYTETEASQVIKIDKNGYVYAFGNKVQDNPLTAGKWYKFNLVVKGGKGGITNENNGNTIDSAGNYPVIDSSNTNTYSFYIDNKAVVTDKVFTPRARIADSGAWADRFQWQDSFLGFRKLALELRTSSATTKTTGVWFDDFSLAQNLTAKPSYEPISFDIAGTNPVAELYKGAVDGDGVQYIDERVDLSNFKYGTKVLESGVLKSGETKNVMGTTQDGEKLFGAVKNYYKRNWDHKFVDNTGNAVLDNSWACTVTSPISSVSYQKTPIAGSNDGDGYIKYEILDTTAQTATGTGKEAAFQTNGGQSKTGMAPTLPFTYEVSLCPKGNFPNIDISLITDKWFRVSLMNDETIKVDGTVCGRYTKGQWIRVAMTAYPAVNLCEVYINGELIGSYPYAKTLDNAQKIQRVKIAQVLSVKDETHYNSASLLLDNIHVTTGSRPDNELATNLSSTTMTVGKRIIFVPKNKTSQEDFYGALNITGKYDANDIKIYSDDTFTAINNSNIKTGNILVIPKTLDYSGEIAYSYYYLVRGKAKDIGVASLTDKLTDEDNSVKAIINYFKPLNKTAKLAIAQYNGDDILVDFDVVDIDATEEIAGHSVNNYEYPYLLKTKEFTIDNYKEGNTLRAFIFNSMDDISPVTEAEIIN